MTNPLDDLHRCDECGQDTAAPARACATCDVDVHVCTPCVAAADHEGTTWYSCHLCRTLRNLAVLTKDDPSPLDVEDADGMTAAERRAQEEGDEL